MDGSPPAGWRYAALEELADVVSGGTPSRAVARYWGGSIPWATPTEVSRASVRYLDSTRESITEAGLKAAGLRILPAGSVLVTTRATIGAVARARVPMTTNQGFQNLVPHAEMDAAWLFYAIEAARPMLHSLAAGSTFKEVSRESFRRLRLLVAPPHEQRAIAAILDTIDEAIALSERAIAASEVLRQTLLHELLTGGMPRRHAERKDWPGLGRVPAAWNVSTLGALGRWTTGGTPSKLRKDYWQGAIPWISPKDMKVPEIWEAADHISEVGAAAGSTIAEPGAILVVVRGMILAHSFPIAVLRVKCAFNQDIRALTCGPDIVPEYVVLALEAQRHALVDLATPTTHGTMRVVLDSLLSRPIALPSPSEQTQIVAAVAAVREKVGRERALLGALQSVKSAIGAALLSGRLRTRVPAMGDVGL